MKCPKCKEEVEMSDAGTISVEVTENNEMPKYMSMCWFCESCDIGGTVKYPIDETTIEME